jgi:hypothetical protein
MRFEGRELKPYAEPVAANDLEREAVYFFVHFVDQEMLVPAMQTVIFIGEDLEPGDEDQVYFQDIDSFNRGVRYGDDGNGDFALFQKGSKNELGHVFTLEHALDVLLACSARRNVMPKSAS